MDSSVSYLGIRSVNVQYNRPIAGSVIVRTPVGDARNYGMKAHRCMESLGRKLSANARETALCRLIRD